MVSVVEGVQPSKTAAVCPEPISGGGGGCGGGGGGGGGGGVSSSGQPGEPGDPRLPDFLQPYPITRWKGPVKVTTTHPRSTGVLEGEVTFESGPFDHGLHPSKLIAVEGSVTYRGTISLTCTHTIVASGSILRNEGELDFKPDPPPPQHATQLLYEGHGGSKLVGTVTLSGSSEICTNTPEPWSENMSWLMVEDATTSPDVNVISGTYTYVPGPGSSLRFEWTLTKQH
jgi:hypothetical protein